MTTPAGGVLALAVAALVGVAAAPALAQSKRYPPPPVDADDVERSPSRLWEEVLHPRRGHYERLVVAARDLLARDRAGAVEEAQKLVEEARQLMPDGVEAHWLAALVYERTHTWQACAEAYDRVYALDPDYRPGERPGSLPAGRQAAWALDYGLATCMAQTGAYERAIAHWTRIAGRGFSAEARVHLPLGETYMALGRLAEAIAVLRAADERASKQPRVDYALAVAYDRNEMPGEARRHLLAAWAKNPSLGALEDPGAIFIPAADGYYYRALAHAERGMSPTALVFFRHYLARAGDGPWAPRAREHIAALAPAASSSALVVASGSLAVDRDTLGEAVGRIDAELQACVRPFPSVLFRLRVNLLAAPRVRRTVGVKAEVVHAFDADDAAVAAAQGCLEGVAEGLPLPVPARAQGSLTVDLPVIAR
ncbi:tetratricopeptide repeat protein [Haliangium sp.]|uniref:tetratricopeptide repeat protein n=1 Tax=Haliangium sp. TaxID=2663208 RepID=UPI003D1441BB